MESAMKVGIFPQRIVKSHYCCHVKCDRFGVEHTLSVSAGSRNHLHCAYSTVYHSCQGEDEEGRRTTKNDKESDKLNGLLQVEAIHTGISVDGWKGRVKLQGRSFIKGSWYTMSEWVAVLKWFLVSVWKTGAWQCWILMNIYLFAESVWIELSFDCFEPEL